MINNKVVNRLLFILAFVIMLVRGFIYTNSLPWLHYFCLAGKTALIPIALALALRTPGKPTGIDYGLLAYCAAMFACCLINHTSVLSLTLLSLDIFIFWALCRWFFTRRSLFPLKVITCVLLLFIALNFVLLLWRPTGLWLSDINGVMYFLLGGNYNNMGKAFFIAIITNMLLLRFLQQPATREAAMEHLFYRVTLVVTIALSLISLLIVGSKTSLVGIVLIVGFGALLYVPRRIVRTCCLTAFVALYFVLQIWAVFFDMSTPSPKAEYIVEEILHKDMTFTERTYVWDRAKQLIRQRPAVGYGSHDLEWYMNDLNVLTTHNLVLHILLKGGWTALTAFIILIGMFHFRLLRRRQLAGASLQRWADTRYILLFSMWTFLFMMIFEVYTFFSLSILIIYAGYLDRLNDGPAAPAETGGTHIGVS